MVDENYEQNKKKYRKKMLMKIKNLYKGSPMDTVEYKVCNAYFLSRILNEKKAYSEMFCRRKLTLRQQFKVSWLLRFTAANKSRLSEIFHNEELIAGIKEDIQASLSTFYELWQVLLEERVDLGKLDAIAHQVHLTVLRCYEHIHGKGWAVCREAVHCYRVLLTMMVYLYNDRGRPELFNGMVAASRLVDAKKYNLETAIERGNFFEARQSALIIASTTNEFIGVISQVNAIFTRDFGHLRKNILK